MDDNDSPERGKDTANDEANNQSDNQNILNDDLESKEENLGGKKESSQKAEDKTSVGGESSEDVVDGKGSEKGEENYLVLKRQKRKHLFVEYQVKR